MNIATNSQIGERIRARRTYLDIPQKDVARQLGTSRVSYGRYESGETSIPAEDLGKLAVILGVPVTYFYGDEDSAVTENLMTYYNALPATLRPLVLASVKGIYDEYWGKAGSRGGLDGEGA